MQLLKHFHELSLHPKNAKELKGLILQLALQGKLTSNWRLSNPDIEPASILLERIKSEKAKSVKAKKIKKEKLVTLINEDEISFDLPHSWMWTRLGVIIKISSGNGLTSANMDKTGTIPVYGGNGITGYHSSGNVNKRTIVIGRVGFYCGSVHLTEKEAWITDNAFITQYSESNIFRDFLVLLLRGTNLKEDENATAQPVISGRKVYPIIIALPPLEEQKAIVKVVEQLFHEVEQLEQFTEERIQLKEQFTTSALRELTTNNTVKEWEALQPHFHTFFNEEPNIKKLRETILQLAVQGKLTAHWRSIHSPFSPYFQGEMSEGQRGSGGRGDAKDHDATLLLERIKVEKAKLIHEKKIKKEKPLPPIADDEIPYALPVGWVWTWFGNLNSNVHYGFTASALHTFKGIRMLRITDIQNNTVNWETVPDCDISEKEFIKYKLEENDILIARTGGTIGKSYQIKSITVKAVFASYLIRAIPLKQVLAEYEKLFIETPLYWKQLIDFSMGTGQPNVNATSLKNLIVPLPPFKEQKAIVETVNRLMALCDKLEQQVKLSKEQVEKWMKGSLREVLEK